MQQNLLSVLEISNTQYPKLLESNPNLVTNTSFILLFAGIFNKDGKSVNDLF